MASTLKGLHYKTEKPIIVEIDSDSISFIEGTEDNSVKEFIAPGLVDLQVNGFNGIDFNQGSLTSEEVLEVTKALWKVGTTSYFPTLITNSNENISSVIRSIVKACKDFSIVNDSILGIHLEGPFVSNQNGPRGAHPKEFIKAPDWNLILEWQRLAEGRIKIITLAPELPQAQEFIKKCVYHGILVSIGHTAANAEEIETAIKAGALMSTHLGNACHEMLPRHHNYIWDQLSSELLWITIIADGFHLPPSLIKIFLKVKTGKCILISDATKFAGLRPGTYTSHIGGEVELLESGKLQIKNNPSMLAGSAQSLISGIQHLVSSGLSSLPDAIEMASIMPARILKLEKLEMSQGSSADLIIYEVVNGNINIKKTLKSGRIVYSI